MPDQADIEQALAALGAEALRDDPAEVRVYRGWPRAASLEADLQAGRAHLSVTPGGAARDATRYPAEWQGVVPAATLQAAPAPTLQVAVDGEDVTFGGVAGPGQVAGLRVDGVAYACRLRDGDTPGAVAAVLAGLVRVDRPVELHGAAVTLPGGRGLLARVVADGSGGTELRRQVQLMRMSLWCPAPAVRDRLAALLDLAAAASPMLDVGGWACRVRAAGGVTTDEGAAAGVWRRDLVYSVEYPTVLVEALPAMLWGTVSAGDRVAVG